MWNLICFRLALWPTLRQKLMNFWSFLTRLGELSILSWVSQFFNFSHDKTPNLMVFRKISFWNEMFLCCIKNVYCCSIVIDNSPHVNAENCKLYNAVSKRVRGGFARHLKSFWRSYVLQLRRNELKCGFYRQKPTYRFGIYILILHK